MCDPLSLGMLAIGVAGTAANSIGQMNAAKKQEEAYNTWAAQQKTNRANENLRQQEFREGAEAARQQGVADLDADNQKKVQAEEEARLASLYSEEGTITAPATGTAPSASDAALAGQQAAGGQVFQDDLARGLADAAASAKQRIGALATVNSYGGSYGGLGTVNPIALQESGSGIDEANEYRRGSLSAYGVEQAVDPEQITYTPSPIASIASSFLGAGMQGLGGSLVGGGGGTGKIMANAVAPPIPRPNPWPF